jgi:hypothetical protein
MTVPLRLIAPAAEEAWQALRGECFRSVLGTEPWGELKMRPDSAWKPKPTLTERATAFEPAEPPAIDGKCDRRGWPWQHETDNE